MNKFVRVACFLFALAPVATLWSQEKIDLETMSRIRYEGFHDSKVMDYATGLMDSIGERLTGSPNMKRANEWTRDQLTAMGLSNAHLEPWGPFGRGWANQYVNVRMTSPDVVTLLAYPKAWTPGTNGVVTGKCIRATIDKKEDFDKYKGKLAGMIVILGADADVKPITEAPYKRLSDDDLAKMADYQIPDRPPFGFAAFVKRQQFIKDLNQFFTDEKVLAVIDHSRGTAGGGTVFVQSGGSYKTGETTTVPQLTMASEHWTRIARLLQQKKDVSLELNVTNTFYDDDPMQYDTIAEIPGTDKKDELVMLGAHLDSWHAGTGATDNGAGTIVMMEAMRILKALNIQPRRTIRIGLWSGEEEGLLGSQGYVEHHFGSRPHMDTEPGMKDMPTLLRREAGEVTVKPEQAKVSVYFNVDNGSGKIRGVHLQENEAVAPIFEAWMKPFKDLGMTTLTMRNTGGTDHLSFDAVGIPGFQFIQDPIEYETRTHHSNMDVYDRLQPDDLKQISVIVAGFVYDAAMRDQMLPRKPIEKALPREAEKKDE
jgi:hypothetical protein